MKMDRALQASYRFCGALSRREARNFYYAFLLLPAVKRRSMCALYAFLRHTDDLADEPASAADKARALDAWRLELESALTGRRTVWPGFLAVADTVARHSIPSDLLTKAIDGAFMDVEPRRFVTFDDLADYCYHVASVVGLSCLHIWGYRSEGGKAERLAESCGIALQLTNIIRDVREDARNGRIYLPEEDLARFGVEAHELSQGGRTSDRVRALLAFEGARAYEYYARANPLAPLVDHVGRPVLQTIVGIYRALLDEIARREYHVLDGRISLQPWRKAAVALKAITGRFNDNVESPPEPAGSMTTPFPKPAPPHVVIVGGGLAGLATASALVDRNLQVTIVESRPRLGGRASSFTDPTTGELVDNCQHVSMRCCTNLADFCRHVGIASMLRREREINFLGPDARVSRFRCGIGPAPFHLARSFLAAKFLSVRDKIRVAYGLAFLAGTRDDIPGESFAGWLRRHRQSDRSINMFWAPVLVSALNERLDKMDVGHGRKVFLDGFLRNRTGFQPEIPMVPLGELYGTRLASWLGDHDVTVRLTTGVSGVRTEPDGSVNGVVLRTGEQIAADFVVLAVPFDRVCGLIPEEIRPRLPALAQVESLCAAPITGVHLWFDRPVCPFDHVVTPGRLIQWVFTKTEQRRAKNEERTRPADNAAPTGSAQYLQLVISASYDLLALDKMAIRDAVMDDLAAIWPVAREARLLRWWVVTEHGATFAVRPGVDNLRPPQRTPIDGLFLAGDWTDTGWPATMEGAVRSGYLAAEGILSVLDRPACLIRLGLKPGLLAGWLFGKGEDRVAPPPQSLSPRWAAPPDPVEPSGDDEAVASSIANGLGT